MRSFRLLENSNIFKPEFKIQQMYTNKMLRLLSLFRNLNEMIESREMF